MRSQRFRPAVPLVLALVVSTSFGRASAVDLPERLSDQEFWKLSQDLSEPDGSFQSDNLLSNEVVFGRLVPDLIQRTKPGGVYLGVGPEQNFTYIAAMKPGMAFITDIRRGNLHLQLMYKALFELSKDRAEFVSRLFTKPRPAALTSSSSVLEIMNAYWDTYTSNEAAFQSNLAAVHAHLTKTRRIPLDQADLDGIANVYRAFYWYGPSMNYSARVNLAGTAPLMMSGSGTYWAMMTQTDANGQAFSYLASEEKFAVVRNLQSRNLIVPVVGNFSGPKALRAVGAYIKERGATVDAFYLSNVESYLQRSGTWNAFCANVATFPLDDASLFIRPSSFRSVAMPVSPPIPAGQTPPPQLFQFVQQGSGTVSMITADGLRLLTGSVDSSALVPPKSSPMPTTTSDSSVRAAGLIAIKGEVATCTSASR